MRQPIVDVAGNRQFDHKVHHHDPTGKLSKVTPYQLSIVRGHHFYFADGRVYAGNGTEIAFEQIPEELRKQWHILSPEAQQENILREKIAARKKAEAEIKEAQGKLARMRADEAEERETLKKNQKLAADLAAKEKAEADAEYQKAVKADLKKEDKGRAAASTFGDAPPPSLDQSPTGSQDDLP